MAERTRGAERKLSDYPISLRQSARAVFGNVLESDEKRALETAAQDKPHSKS